MHAGIAFALKAFVLVLATLVVRLRVQPEHPATAAEIEADGGSWVEAPDGRLLEYFTCGVKGGPWVYYQHPYGNTGKFIFVIPDICSAAEELGLHVFSPSQPGFGLSSTYPLDRVRTLQEWPADIELIMDKEDIREMYVSGQSAGGVHALTVAHHFGDRILGVGVNTPTTPLSVESATNSQMALPTRFVRTVFEYPYLGDALGWVMSKMSGRQRMEAAPDVKEALNKMERLAAEGSEAWGAVLKEYCADQDRGMRKGYRGWQDNMAILNQDVPFAMSELGTFTSDGKRFVVTTAPDDTTNPPVMQTWWVDNIPGAELMHCEAGWGHLHGTVPGMYLELFKRMTNAK